jgi:hypothetical protein
MEPLNKQERTEAFLKVLALFLLAVILIAIPMYYLFRLPCIESNVNTKEYERLQKQMKDMSKYHQQFLLKTDSALSIFGKYEQEKERFAREKIRPRYPLLSNDMEDYTKAIPDDTLKSLYTDVRLTFDKLFISQDKIFNLENVIDTLKNGGKNDTPPPPEPLSFKLDKIIKAALDKNNRSKRLAGEELGLNEKIISLIMDKRKL